MNRRFQQKLNVDEDDEHYLEEADQSEDCPQDQLSNNEEDPLQAFMSDLHQQNKRMDPNKQLFQKPLPQKLQNDPELLQDDESQESRKNEQKDRNFKGQLLENEQEDYEGRTEPNRKIIEILKPVDYSQLQLEKFDKDFYIQHEQISNLTATQVARILQSFEIKLSGVNPPRPVVSFGHLGFQSKLLALIAKNGFESPTPIQAIALPAALSGRDVVGIAKTGSGKTLAFVWPMIVHVGCQRPSNKNEGPVALVLAPTRELCQQIYLQIKKYSKKYRLKTACLLGGENKHEQWKTLKGGVDVLVASPGRLIEMVRKKATNLLRVTYLVLDQADRMLSLGFEQQIRSIVSQTREERQTLLFTATMKLSMRILVGDIVDNPVRILVGEQGAANENVQQSVQVLADHAEKLEWLVRHIPRFIEEGKTLIFANERHTCQEVGQQLRKRGIQCLVLHGEKNQQERTSIMNSFKALSPILVATDIAARGIDVKCIKNVINFECPKHIEAYIHRVGRAGRAGDTGKTTALLTKDNIKFAISLIKVLQSSGYPVQTELENLACLDERFGRKRLSSKMGVSFAKGKDAKKYLNQIIKKQKKGFSKAGLGMNEHSGRQIESGPSLGSQLNTKDMTIQEISAAIQEKYKQSLQQTAVHGHFVRQSAENLPSDNTKEVTISYFEKNPSQKK